MEILKRAREGGEIVPRAESQKNIEEEVHRRTHKAGYTDRDGQPKISRQTAYSKGDAFRPMNKKKYDENYVRIFGS